MLKAIFISVRTGSTRLPNKSILKIKDKYTIEYVIDSVKKSKYADEVVLCTTKKINDTIQIRHNNMNIRINPSDYYILTKPSKSAMNDRKFFESLLNNL